MQLLLFSLYTLIILLTSDVLLTNRELNELTVTLLGVICLLLIQAQLINVWDFHCCLTYLSLFFSFHESVYSKMKASFCSTYSFKHWDLVQLQGFLGRAPVASNVGLKKKKRVFILNTSLIESYSVFLLITYNHSYL